MKEETVDSLKDKIRSLQVTNTHLSHTCNRLQKKAQKWDAHCTKRDRLIQATKFCIAFLRLTKPFCPSSGIIGSFIRKMLEFTFLHPTNDWVGNVQNLEITVCFNMQHAFSSEEARLKNQEAYLLFINFLQAQKEAQDTVMGFKCTEIHFGCVKDAQDFSEKYVSNCTLLFKNETQMIMTTIYAYLPMSLVDFSVNGCKMTLDGIGSFVSGHDFFMTMDNLLHSEACFLRKIDQMQQAAFPPNESVTREVKLKYMSQISSVLLTNIVPLIESDYHFVGLVPEIQLEQKEDCFITGCKPPYPSVVLECGHQISIMAYYGIVHVQPHESTESIKCPVCRGSLKLRMKNSTPKKCEVVKPNQTRTREEINNTMLHIHKHKSMSYDALTWNRPNFPS